jgi:hypothetical protein
MHVAFSLSRIVMSGLLLESGELLLLLLLLLLLSSSSLLLSLIYLSIRISSRVFTHRRVTRKYCITLQITSKCKIPNNSTKQSPVCKANCFSLIKKFPSFYEIRRSITVLTTARHLTVSWARSILSNPSKLICLKIHFNIILPSTHRSFETFLSLPSDFFTKSLYSPLPFTKRTICPVHLFLDLIS